MEKTGGLEEQSYGGPKTDLRNGGGDIVIPAAKEGSCEVKGGVILEETPTEKGPPVGEGKWKKKSDV